ncbi:hypothetical protein GCM10009623_28420 [Nocardioides aestuarii]
MLLTVDDDGPTADPVGEPADRRAEEVTADGWAREDHVAAYAVTAGDLEADHGGPEGIDLQHRARLGPDHDMPVR